MNGHIWTVLPHLRNRMRRDPEPSDIPWATTVDDPQVGAVRLTGALRRVAGSDTVALIIHGLGGNADAGYCLDAADAVHAAGWSSLRLHLRGADGLGQDLYHAALTSDLDAALASQELAGFARVVVIGFSLGGHLALRYALQPAARVHRVVAVCSPLDLAKSALAFDRRRATPYRVHVLRELKGAVATADRRGVFRGQAPAVMAVRTIREWDRHAVVPRFDFDDVADYYATASVGPRLAGLAVPALYIGAPLDPMVPRFTVQDALDNANGRVAQRWIDGDAGHVGFRDPGVFTDMIAWAATP
ncbi:MAG: alpha/beta fold hydrolase [Myxococcota bacterium]